MLIAARNGVRFGDCGFDEAKVSISKFEEEFGSEKAVEYSGEEPITAKGRIYRAARCVRRLVRSGRQQGA